MNIVANLISRVEESRGTNKNPCKNYATEAAAVKAAEKITADAQAHFGTSQPANYLAFFVPSWGRWCVAINTNEYYRRHDFPGGYIGYFASCGHFGF